MIKSKLLYNSASKMIQIQARHWMLCFSMQHPYFVPQLIFLLISPLQTILNFSVGNFLLLNTTLFENADDVSKQNMLHLTKLCSSTFMSI